MIRLLPVLLLTVMTTLDAAAQTTEDQAPWLAESVEKFASKTSAKIKKSSSASVPKDGTQKLTKPQQEQARVFKRESKTLASQDHLIWVYDAWVALRGDSDHDRYYQSFEVTFDVDTSLSHADVYARLYLGDGEVFREFHTTSVFHIDALDSDDEFVVETSLLEGFHSLDYDILIEIYDANTGTLEDSYDHTDDADLSLVPLESQEFDVLQGSGSGVLISVSHEHGGASEWVFIGFIMLTIMLRRWRTQRYTQATKN